MSFSKVHRAKVQDLMEKIALCTIALEEVNQSLINPVEPEARADLLFAVEDLAYEATVLYERTNELVWAPTPKE